MPNKDARTTLEQKAKHHVALEQQISREIRRALTTDAHGSGTRVAMLSQERADMQFICRLAELAAAYNYPDSQVREILSTPTVNQRMGGGDDSN